MRRPGHHRPIGSLTPAWRFNWNEPDPPGLGDIVFEISAPGVYDADELERGFLLVGIEETSSRARPYRLTFERLAWQDAIERAHAGARTWVFYIERSRR